MTFDQSYIDQLVTCEKMVIKEPGAWKEERGHWRVNFDLRSYDGNWDFSAFGRYNSRFPENFSFGLVFQARQEKIRLELIRCNGPHGAHRQFPHHQHFHIHKARADNIHDGFKDDLYVEITTEYGDFNEAYRYFVRYINVRQTDIDKFFPPVQLNLF